MNYSKFLNPVSLARQIPSWMHFSHPKAKCQPNAIQLANIIPNSDIFPFHEAKLELRDGSELHLNKEQLEVGLQYNHPAGNSDLLEWLKEFQYYIHKPPPFETNHSKICLTSGSMEGLSKAFEMLISPGENVLIETPTYAGVLSALRPLQCNIVPIETDHHGIIPLSLNDALHNLKTTGKHSNPKFLYTIPNGTNPTGASTTMERKKQIYEIAREHDFLILEDDPYYFLQFSLPRLVSYLSMDTDGRVLRFDSFSKILSSGLRLGFVTGPEVLVDRIVMHHSVSSIHASHLSQIIAYQILKKWEIRGFEDHVSKVVKFYTGQKDLMIKYAKKWLKDLAEWDEPVAGMFLWMKLKTINDTKKIIEEKAKEKKVLLVPGCAFYPNDEAPTPYVRTSFSICSEKEIDEGFKRLAELIKDELSK